MSPIIDAKIHQAVEALKAYGAQQSILVGSAACGEADEHSDLDYVPNTARSARIDIALKNSFGFGGKNSALVVGTCHEVERS